MAPIAIDTISFWFGQIWAPNSEKGVNSIAFFKLFKLYFLYLFCLFEKFEWKVTILGRPMKCKLCEDAERCLTITDESSGIIATKIGTSWKEAIHVSTKQMYEELLKTDKFSLQDLCDQRIRFNHPGFNQFNCKL